MASCAMNGLAAIVSALRVMTPRAPAMRRQIVIAMLSRTG